MNKIDERTPLAATQQAGFFLFGLLGSADHRVTESNQKRT